MIEPKDCFWKCGGTGRIEVFLGYSLFGEMCGRKIITCPCRRK